MMQALTLFSTIYVGILLIQLASGQCDPEPRSCPCVPSDPAQIGTENRCCLSVRENLPPGSVIGNANDLALIDAVRNRTTMYVAPTDGLAGRLFSVNATTGAITTNVSIDREDITALSGVQGDCILFAIQPRDPGRSMPLTTVTALFGVVILDENDNRPQFVSNINVLNITVNENDAPNTLNCQDITKLASLQVTDMDIGSNGEVTYKVAEGSGNDIFEVTDPMHPCVDNLVAMDRESNASYSFVLVAMDGGNPPMMSNITVVFTLLDINDNPPRFSSGAREINVYENTSVGTVIYQFEAIDNDLETQPLRYELELNLAPFQINHKTGELNLTSMLNAEGTVSQYQLTVSATDSGQHKSSLSVTINIIDVNEQLSEVTALPPSALIEENIKGFVFTLHIVDDDKDMANRMNSIQFESGGEYFTAVGPFNVGGIRQTFSINQNMPIDRENVTDGNLTLSIILQQHGDPPLERRYEHNFTISDINDNEPYLTKKEFNFTETPNDVEDTVAMMVKLKEFVRDDDAGDNGTVVSYSLLLVRSSNGRYLIQDFRTSNALREMDNDIHEGNLLLPSNLDREYLGGLLTITMNFTDGGSPSQSKVDSFTIKIIDINDNAPVFVRPEYEFYTTENRNPDVAIGSVVANDLDDHNTVNGMVVYSLEMRGDFKYFTVDQNNGTINSDETFDREAKDRFVIYVSARDAASPPRIATESAMVTIIIQDLNDEPPVFTMERYIFQVQIGANVDDFVGNVKAIDRDLNSELNQVVYKFLYPTSYFLINNSSGDITLSRVLSIQDSPYNLTVAAHNPGFEQLRNTATVSIAVLESPLLTSTFIGAISGVTALILIVAIVIVCCCIFCVHHKSRTGKLQVDGNGSQLNNQKPILKTFPATNGQQRSVKFSTMVEETHYDPSGIGEHSVIRKESNLGSGDESPQTSIRITMPNGSVNINGHNQETEIVDYEMSPNNMGINGDVTHPRSQCTRHGNIPSPIMLQEELNTSEFSQSTGSVIDDRNTYNSEGEEDDSTFSDAPSNYNSSIPRFGRQTIQVEDHRRHTPDLGRFGGPPASHQPLNLHAHLPRVHHVHGQHSSPGHLAELQAHNLAALNSQYASTAYPTALPLSVPPTEDNCELSLSSLPRNISHHHHHGSISRVTSPREGHTSTRKYLHSSVIPQTFPKKGPSFNIRRCNLSFSGYGETSTYSSTQLDEALQFNYEIETNYCSLTATDYGENNTPPTGGFTEPFPSKAPPSEHKTSAENCSNNHLCNSPNTYEKSPLTFQIHTRNPECSRCEHKIVSANKDAASVMHTELEGNKKISQDIDFDTTCHGESGPKHGTNSSLGCTSTNSVPSVELYEQLYSQHSLGSGVDLAHLMLQANIKDIRGRDRAHLMLQANIKDVRAANPDMSQFSSL